MFLRVLVFIVFVPFASVFLNMCKLSRVGHSLAVLICGSKLGCFGVFFFEESPVFFIESDIPDSSNLLQPLFLLEFSEFLEDISHVLGPHLRRLFLATEISEDTLLPSVSYPFDRTIIHSGIAISVPCSLEGA